MSSHTNRWWKIVEFLMPEEKAWRENKERAELQQAQLEADPISADAHYIAQCAHDDAREASGRMVKHLWFIFVALPFVLGAAFWILTQAAK